MEDIHTTVNRRQPRFIFKKTGKVGLARPTLTWVWHSSAPELLKGNNVRDPNFELKMSVNLILYKIYVSSKFPNKMFLLSYDYITNCPFAKTNQWLFENLSKFPKYFRSQQNMSVIFPENVRDPRSQDPAF
jgi:hypothetical protein